MSTVVLGLSPSSPETHLDPNYRLAVGHVLRRTFAAWARHLGPFTIVAFVMMSPILAGRAALLLLPHASRDWGFIVLEVLEPLVFFALAGVITYAVFQDVQGQRASLTESLRGGIPHAGRVVRASALMYLAILLGTMACGAPGIYAMIVYWVVVPVAVVESHGAFASLRRSRELTTGNRWRIFGVLLVVLTITIGIMHVMGQVLGLFGLQLDANQPRSPGSVAYRLIAALVNLPFTPLQAISQLIAYHDLRVGREGADVEELVKVFE
jgi:hypothetical protein